MTRAQPHDLFVGLQGLYLPSHSEHHYTKTQAIESLREFKDRSLWDEPDVRGQVRYGYIVWGAEYASVEPCLDPDNCESEETI